MHDEGEEFRDVLQWCKYYCIWSGIKAVGSMNFPMDIIVLADELDDTVGDMVEVDNGRVTVQAHCMKLVAVLCIMKKIFHGSIAHKKISKLKRHTLDRLADLMVTSQQRKTASFHLIGDKDGLVMHNLLAVCTCFDQVCNQAYEVNAYNSLIHMLCLSSLQLQNYCMTKTPSYWKFKGSGMM